MPLPNYPPGFSQPLAGWLQDFLGGDEPELAVKAFNNSPKKEQVDAWGQLNEAERHIMEQFGAKF